MKTKLPQPLRKNETGSGFFVRVKALSKFEDKDAPSHIYGWVWLNNEEIIDGAVDDELMQRKLHGIIRKNGLSGLVIVVGYEFVSEEERKHLDTVELPSAVSRETEKALGYKIRATLENPLDEIFSTRTFWVWVPKAFVKDGRIDVRYWEAKIADGAGLGNGWVVRKTEVIS